MKFFIEDFFSKCDQIIRNLLNLTTGFSRNYCQENDKSHERAWEMCITNLGCSNIKFEESKGILFYKGRS